MINLYFHKITDTQDIIYRVESLSGIIIEPQYYKTSSYTIDGETVYPLNEIDNDFIRNFCDVYQNDFDDALLKCFYVSNVQLESMESFLENSWHIQNFWIRGDIQ